MTPLSSPLGRVSGASSLTTKERETRRGAPPRKLPPDPELAVLLASGEFYAEIARRHRVTDGAVRLHARRLGFDPISPGTRQGKRNSHAAVDCA